MKIVIVDDDIFVSGALTITILKPAEKLLLLLPVQTEKKLQNCTKSISRMYFLWIFE